MESAIIYFSNCAALHCQEDKMSITAKLKVVVLANDAEVTVSENSILWQKVLDAIHKEESTTVETHSFEEFSQDDDTQKLNDNFQDPIQTFAKKIGVSSEIVQGACSPTTESPYIHLDKHFWEALRKNLPAKGLYAVAPMAIAATILSSWNEHMYV